MKKSERRTEKKSKLRMERISASAGEGGELREEGGAEKVFGKLGGFARYIYRAGGVEMLSASRLIRGIIMGALAFIFGRTSFILDTYTLGIALLCAVEGEAPFVLLGAVISAFTVITGDGGVLFSPYIYTVAYVMIFLLRILSRALIDTPSKNFSVVKLFSGKGSGEERKRAAKELYYSVFEENVYLRMALSSVAAFFVSLWVLNKGSYRYYDLFSAMFAMLSAPAFTFMLCGLHKSAADKTDRMMRYVSEIAVITFLSYGLRETSPLGINLSVFAVFFAVLYTTEKRGLIYSSLAGFFGGMAISPIYAPAFILAALSVFLLRASPFAASALAAFLAILWGAYIDGIAAFTFIMPAIICASVVYCASGRIFSSAQIIEVEAEGEASQVITEQESLIAMSSTFSDIAKELYAVTEELKRPCFSRLKDISLCAFESRCEKCEKERTCRGEDYSSFCEMTVKTAEILARDGRLRSEMLPRHIREGCIHIEDVVREANTEYAKLMSRKLRGEKTELFAIDYEAFSQLLADASARIRDERVIDRELTERLSRFGERSDIGMKEICVYGNGRKTVYSGNIGRKAEKKGIDQLKSELEEVCGFPLTSPVFELKSGKIAMSARASEKIGVTCEKLQKVGEGEQVCGDTADFFISPDGRGYALICDGMGKGEEAEITSRIGASFMRKMLEGGNRKEIALKMLNNLLRSKGEECSVTVDLMEIDLISGSASFVKSGAAPSFVRRGDKLYKLRSETAPIGIMNAIDAEQVSFSVEAGDIIIMMSDGIGQFPEDRCGVMEILCGDIDDDRQSFAKRLIECAANEGETDDATVLVVEISAA